MTQCVELLPLVWKSVTGIAESTWPTRILYFLTQSVYKIVILRFSPITKKIAIFADSSNLHLFFLLDQKLSKSKDILLKNFLRLG